MNRKWKKRYGIYCVDFYIDNIWITEEERLLGMDPDYVSVFCDLYYSEDTGHKGLYEQYWVDGIVIRK